MRNWFVYWIGFSFGAASVLIGWSVAGLQYWWDRRS